MKIIKVVLVLVVIFLFACRVNAGGPALTIPLHASSISLNPSTDQDFSSLWVSRQVNCQLLRNKNGVVIYDLANKMHYLNSTTLNITLRKNILFSDRSQVTANDVVMSIRYLKKNRKVLKNALEWIQSINVLSKFKVQIILKKPYHQFLQVFSAPNYAIFSAKFLKNVAKNPKLWKKPVSCGAYSILKNNKKEIYLSPRKKGFLPIKYIFVPSGIVTEKEATKYDIVSIEIKGDHSYLSKEFNKVKLFDPFQFFYFPNTKKYPWNSRNNRCALLARLNPNNVISDYGSAVKPANDLVPSGTLGYDPHANYNKKIRGIGLKLSLPKVKNFCFSFIKTSVEKNIRLGFKTMFEKIFPQVRMRPLVSSVHLGPDFLHKQCDGIILALKSNYLDAYEYLLIFSEPDTNVSGYFSKGLSTEIENSQNIIQPFSRIKTYRDIIRKLQSRCLVKPLFTMPYDIVYVKKSLKPVGIGAGPLNEYLLTKVIRR